MKTLPQYAKEHGIKYRAAWNRFKAGKIPGAFQDEHRKILIPAKPVKERRVAIYTRVSSAENRSNLETQVDRLVSYCAAKGYQVHKVVKEIGSGVNESRTKFLKLLADTSITHIVVEHKDRATRFGFNYIETLLNTQERSLEVVNLAENGKEELIQDFVSIVYSFSARLYGRRRAKRKTEKIIQEFQSDDETTPTPKQRRDAANLPDVPQ